MNAGHAALFLPLEAPGMPGGMPAPAGKGRADPAASDASEPDFGAGLADLFAGIIPPGAMPVPPSGAVEAEGTAPVTPAVDPTAGPAGQTGDHMAALLGVLASAVQPPIDGSSPPGPGQASAGGAPPPLLPPVEAPTPLLGPALGVPVAGLPPAAGDGPSPSSAVEGRLNPTPAQPPGARAEGGIERRGKEGGAHERPASVALAGETVQLDGDPARNERAKPAVGVGSAKPPDGGPLGGPAPAPPGAPALSPPGPANRWGAGLLRSGFDAGASPPDAPPPIGVSAVPVQPMNPHPDPSGGGEADRDPPRETAGHRAAQRTEAGPPLPPAMPSPAGHAGPATFSTEETPRLAPRSLEGIVAAIRVSHERRGGEVRMQLWPEQLGEVRIHVAVAEGALEARIQAGTPEAREALAGSLPQLREALGAHGIRVERFEVQLGFHLPAGGERGGRAAGGPAGSPWAGPGVPDPEPGGEGVAAARAVGPAAGRVDIKI
jgi:flagellar hook-length control protein FliK